MIHSKLMANFALAAVAWTTASARDFSQFEFLLERSPFSLPTAEETSPLAERYVLTGAAEWEGRQRVFVLDKTSQQRHVVTSDGGTSDMLLLEYLPAADPRQMRARLQIGGQITTIGFGEAGFDGNAAEPFVGASAVPFPAAVPPQPGSHGAHQVVNASNPGGPSAPPRIIRRRTIALPQGQQPAVHGQPPGDSRAIIRREVVNGAPAAAP